MSYTIADMLTELPLEDLKHLRKFIDNLIKQKEGDDERERN